MNARAVLLPLLVSGPLLAERGTVTGTVTAFPSKYLAETVVYLRDAPPPRAPRRHRVRQKGMSFLPHVLAIAGAPETPHAKLLAAVLHVGPGAVASHRAAAALFGIPGFGLHEVNVDTVDHNVFSPDGEKYNLGVFSNGEARERIFARPGVYTQQCSMHPEMFSYVFVGTSAHAAVVDGDGRFTIPDVPAGSWKIAIWNPRLSAPDQTVIVAPGGTAAVRFDAN